MAITKADELKAKLTWAMEKANQIRVKIADELMKSPEAAEYQLRWMEGKYEEIYYGSLCAAALKGGIKTTMQWAQMQKSMWSPHNSSSQFSNACHNEQFKALTNFIRDFGSYAQGE